MANKKISQLPLDSTITGNENLVNQDGITNYRVPLSSIRDWILSFFSSNIDGGNSNSVYLSNQIIDGGNSN